MSDQVLPNGPGVDFSGLLQSLLAGRQPGAADPTVHILGVVVQDQRAVIQDLVLYLREERRERNDLRNRVDKLTEALEKARLEVTDAQLAQAATEKAYVKRELTNLSQPPQLQLHLAEEQVEDLKATVAAVEAQRKRDTEELVKLLVDVGTAVGLDANQPRSPGRWAREIIATLTTPRAGEPLALDTPPDVLKAPEQELPRF